MIFKRVALQTYHSSVSNHEQKSHAVGKAANVSKRFTDWGGSDRQRCIIRNAKVGIEAGSGIVPGGHLRPPKLIRQCGGQGGVLPDYRLDGGALDRI